MSTISKFDMQMFKTARAEAKKSDYDKFHLGAVVVYKHKIIGRGHNKDRSHPLQVEYNKYRKFNNTDGIFIKHSIHAELDALVSIPYCIGKAIDAKNDWNKVKIFVYRISKKNQYACAKPCPSCMAAIKDFNIRNVYYTDDDGYAYLRLDDSEFDHDSHKCYCRN